MVLITIGDNPAQAALKLHLDLISVRKALEIDNVVLNDKNQQLYGPSEAERKAWQALTSQEATPQVRDLGIWHYGYSYKHPPLDEQLHTLKATAVRIGTIPIPKERKATMAAAILYGKCLYGQEAHFLTARHFKNMRSVMCTALGERATHRPRARFSSTWQAVDTTQRSPDAPDW